MAVLRLGFEYLSSLEWTDRHLQPWPGVHRSIRPTSRVVSQG
jgi:hypothetical protein